MVNLLFSRNNTLPCIILLFLDSVFIGDQLLAQEEKLNSKDSLNVAERLARQKTVDTDIATGYTIQLLRDITGSVSVVDPATLKSVPSGIITNQLQGRVPGLTVTGNGQPGAMSKVRLRGFSSFENNDPLYIVDGVPTQDISALNPNDVASISVLKDAGAASVYGSRASNGVIIITTRRGDNGIHITYDMFTGTQLPGKGPAKSLLTTKEYANLQWLVYKNDGTVEFNPIYGLSTSPTPTLPAWAANTDWYGSITDRAGIQNHDLTLSGGNENSRFFSGVGIFRQDGIVIHTHSERYSLRFNSDFTFLNKRIRAGESLSLAYRTRLSVPNLTENSPIQMGPYRSQPIIPVIWTQPELFGLTHTFEPGDWGGTGISPRLGQAANEVASLTRAKDNGNWNLHLLGNAYIDVKIVEGLDLKSTLGGTFDDGYLYSYTYKTYEQSENNVTNSFNEGAYYGNDWVWTNTLTLDKTLGKHKILTIAGYEAIRYGIGRTMAGQRSGYFSDDVNYRSLDNGATVDYATSDASTPTNMASAFIKADYGFSDKYMVSFAVRRDGSSRFSKSKRFGVFPAVAVAWRISNEPFFSGLSWVSDLKIRGSLGKTGNQLALSPQNAFFRFESDPTSSYYDLNGTFNSSVRGFYPVRIANPDATWESKITTDIGLETTLWNNSLGIRLDWYSGKATDLLYNPVVPGTAGDGEAPFINIAAMDNSGIDLELSYNKTLGNFKLSASAIFTSYKNEITKISDGVTFFGSGSSRIGSLVRNEAGYPVSSFYGYTVQGLFQTFNEVNNAPSQDGAAPGFFRYANIDTTGYFGYGGPSINPNDRTFIGNPNPKFTYGLNLAMAYKSFDLSCFCYGSQGNDILNWNKWWTDFWPSFQGQKSKDLLYNSWTESNKSGTVPKASNTSNFSTNTQVCSYYVEDGSFLRLKTLQIGFTIPEKTCNKLSINSLRFYVQAVNLFTLTKYSGLDPEIGGDDLSSGVDNGNYPIVKQFIFGLNLTLK
jgi:TonB-linked SusC/RagA family outer membrane protein